MRYCLIASVMLLVIAQKLFAQDYDAQWIQAPIPTSIMDFRNDTIGLSNLGNIAYAFNTTGNICDKNGNFLFFSNGVYVRDRNGIKMPQGDSLSFYNPSEYALIYQNGMPQDQGVLILPKPDSDSLYYIFHYAVTDTVYFHQGELYDNPMFFYYSMVNMSANNGLGTVVLKDIRLPINQMMCASRLTAVKHGNGRDWWIIRHGLRDNTYIKFLLTPDTVLGPYFQNIGPDFQQNGFARDFYGASIFNLEGNKMATANFLGPIVVLDFDRCSGDFSNPLIINNQLRDTTIVGARGLVLSPNGRFLYVNNTFELNQYDLLSTNPNDSVRLYTVDSSDYYWMHTMRLGPNRKIYIAQWNGGLRALHVINQPDSLGLACDFQYAGQPCITLNSANLPNMVNYRLGRLKGSACDTVPYLSATGVVTRPSCYGVCDGAIEISHTGGLQPPFFYKWSNDSTTKKLSSVCAGVYTVTATDMWDTSIVTFTVTEPSFLSVSIIPQDVSCFGSNNGNVTIFPTGGIPPYNYVFSSSPPYAPGNYSVAIVDSNGCSVSGTFSISQPDSLVITMDSITNDNGTSNGAIAISVTGGMPPYTFQWSNADTTEDVSQLSFGTYSVNITDANGCIATLQNIMVEFVDAIFEQDKEAIRIYPNPVRETLHISLPTLQHAIQTIIIVDIHGKEILQTTETSISVQNYSQGVYFVKLQFESGKSAVRKIVVQ